MSSSPFATITSGNVIFIFALFRLYSFENCQNSGLAYIWNSQRWFTISSLVVAVAVMMMMVMMMAVALKQHRHHLSFPFYLSSFFKSGNQSKFWCWFGALFSNFHTSSLRDLLLFIFIGFSFSMSNHINSACLDNAILSFCSSILCLFALQACLLFFLL